ncbi:MAG: hormogonium polysaccharide biosynthesis protein HpsA, partial [Coleofasciculaceae cyanobacterium]
VVTLLTTAIMIRSFDRSKNASNVRVNQAVLNAATPAIDRARAKINKLFSSDELLGNTPPESNIADLLSQDTYKFGDEEQIELTGQFETAPDVDDARTLNSAWRFPVDTDNNGKFDTFTLYGIYFRNPQTANNNENNRQRGTTEARALPQDDGQADNCGSGASPEAGWYSIGGQLKKAFFTYVANVPITDTAGLEPRDNYEPYKGNKGFSALEMQIDQVRVSLDNNAIWYNDDLTIALIPSLKLNGRVHTNSNLLVENADANPIIFRQVSSPESCFYNPANAKIIVGGNVAAGNIGRSDSGSSAVKVDLYKGKNTLPDRTPIINANNKTTTNTPSEVAANSDAFTQRLDVLVQGAINLLNGQDPTDATVGALAGRYPEELIEAFNEKYDPSNPGGGLNALTQSLETYFGNRIRRVSFAEVPMTDPPTPDAAITVGGTKLSPVVAPTDGGTFVFSGGGEIKPPDSWMTIDPNNTNLTLNINGNTMQMPATDPGTGATSLTKIEEEIGDRVQVGNNLPNRWLRDDDTFAKAGDPQPINGVNWNGGGGQRQRTGLAEQLDDLGDTSRNGYWETAAAKLPPLDEEELAGGLRVVTGAGIYVDGVVGGTGSRMSGVT